METAFEATTDDITVQVRVDYLYQHAKPALQRHLWAYHITITNYGSQTVQLLSRKWEITDANFYTQCITGEGVVGKQPTLKPLEQFSYTSVAPLSTTTGFMVGTYLMQNQRSKERFEIAIPAFSLETPFSDQKQH